ncbi:ADP-ribosylation/Crystallin J1 [Oopsacas minuta]|uniref:ADP-ribosylation/Crystallin J1 n=1 Tax=Oopsacas minuta TaxID=111878 RepID=A0AAV7K7S5_9METZ|nr:ADP-ribosylation/Crystallin J1 [Oopsacas minuta]
MASKDVLDKIHGSLLGLAICDAIGTTVETLPPGSFEPITDMVGGGKFNVLPGQWTDDTSMALCVAESVVECQGYNPVDQLMRFCSWYVGWHFNCCGELIDIGKTVRKSLEEFKKTATPYPGPTSERAAGNGSLMRLCPLPLAYASNPELAMELSARHSRTTHGAQIAIDACRYFAGILIGCIQGESKEKLLSENYSPIGLGYWQKHVPSPEVSKVAQGSYKTKEPPDIKATGFVVDTLEAALWGFYQTDTFKSGCLMVSNLGDDSDTVGAVYGQIAGAFYGTSGIPKEWRDRVYYRTLIEVLSGEIMCLSERTKNANIPDDTNYEKVPCQIEVLGAKYVQMKIHGFTFLEEKSRELVRRLKPCPKQFKNLSEVDATISHIESEYFKLEGVCPELFKDFKSMWLLEKEKLSLRIARKAYFN